MTRVFPKFSDIVTKIFREILLTHFQKHFSKVHDKSQIFRELSKNSSKTFRKFAKNNFCDFAENYFSDLFPKIFRCLLLEFFENTMFCPKICRSVWLLQSDWLIWHRHIITALRRTSKANQIFMKNLINARFLVFQREIKRLKLFWGPNVINKMSVWGLGIFISLNKSSWLHASSPGGGGYFISNYAPQIPSTSSGSGIFVENVYTVSEFSFVLGVF